MVWQLEHCPFTCAKAELSDSIITISIWNMTDAIFIEFPLSQNENNNLVGLISPTTSAWKLKLLSMLIFSFISYYYKNLPVR